MTSHDDNNNNRICQRYQTILKIEEGTRGQERWREGRRKRKEGGKGDSKEMISIIDMIKQKMFALKYIC